MTAVTNANYGPLLTIEIIGGMGTAQILTPDRQGDVVSVLF